MALTGAEEALIRELIAQNAALLALADNEALITSKLGATIVELSDLSPAAGLGGTDLFLIRQGTTDKSATYSQIADDILADSTLTGGPIAPTPAQFDSDTSVATTAFVQRALGNIRAVSTISATSTIPASDAGLLFVTPNAGITVTLPSASGGNGRMISIYNNSSGDNTIAAASINSAYGNGTSIVLPSQSTAVFVCDGTSWNAVGGGASLGVAVRPKGSSGVGEWMAIPTSTNLIYLPAGGQWAYFVVNNGVTYCGIAAGTVAIYSGPLVNTQGFCWRIS